MPNYIKNYQFECFKRRKTHKYLLNDDFKIKGHWKPGRKIDDFPITYVLSGSPQDVSQAKAEIDLMITKVHVQVNYKNFVDTCYMNKIALIDI